MLTRLLLCLLLAGCAEKVSVLQPHAPVVVPEAQPMTLNQVNWQVMSLPELQALVTKLQHAQQTKTIVFVLDTTNYTNLTLNLVEIQRYLKEQKAILEMLTQVIADEQQPSK